MEKLLNFIAYLEKCASERWVAKRICSIPSPLPGEDLFESEALRRSFRGLSPEGVGDLEDLEDPAAGGARINICLYRRFQANNRRIRETGMILPQLAHGLLLRRYKRFLADFLLDDGREAQLPRTVVAHCPNPGSMLGCLKEGGVGYLSRNDSLSRALRYTWELTEVEDLEDPAEGGAAKGGAAAGGAAKGRAATGGGAEGGAAKGRAAAGGTGGILVGINTARTNRIVEEALREKKIPELSSYTRITREVRYGHERSRIDFLLEKDGEFCYLEIKNVTLARGKVASFPDAVTSRGARHLRELMAMKEEGHRAVILFLVSRSDCERFVPADDIDPAYGQTLRKAISSGVEILVYGARVTLQEITLDRRISAVLL